MGQNALDYYTASYSDDKEQVVLKHAGIDLKGHTFAQEHIFFLEDIHDPQVSNFKAQGAAEGFSYQSFANHPELEGMDDASERFANALLIYMEDEVRAENNPDILHALEMRAEKIRAGGSRAEMLVAGKNTFQPSQTELVVATGEQYYALDKHGALHDVPLNSYETVMQAKDNMPYEFLGVESKADAMKQASKPETLKANAQSLKNERFESFSVSIDHSMGHSR